MMESKVFFCHLFSPRESPHIDARFSLPPMQQNVGAADILNVGPEEATWIREKKCKVHFHEANRLYLVNMFLRILYSLAVLGENRSGKLADFMLVPSLASHRNLLDAASS